MTTEIYNMTGDTVTTLAVTFDNDMIWDDEFSWNPVDAETARTVDGGVYVQEHDRANEYGRPITLVARGGMGMQTRTTVAALQALIDADKRYSLKIVHNSITTQKKVRFVTDDEEGPVRMRPAYDVEGNPHSGQWYEGSILFHVSD